MTYVDHHVHFLSTVAAGLSVDVSSARSVAGIARALRSAPPTGPAGWIRAWGYDETALAGGRHPTRADLDRARPDVPVVLHHRTGHAAVMNSPALERTEGPGPAAPGDGVLFDRHDVLARVPRLEPTQLTASARRVSAQWARAGVGAFVDATFTNGPDELALLDRWCAEGVISQQVTAMVSPGALPDVPPYGESFGRVVVGPAKILPGPDLARVVPAAHRAGFPVAIHVTEIDVLEQALSALEASAPPTGTRDRIEHAALSLPAQVERLSRLPVTVVVNPSFLIHRRAKYERELEPIERSWLIRIRSFIDAGVALRAGSDSPVSPARPEQILQAATAHPFSPEESVDSTTAAGLLRP